MILRTFVALGITLAIVPPSAAAYDIFGLRQSIYVPRCAHACREAILRSPVLCSNRITKYPTPGCLAVNDDYLQTLAYCLSQRCNGTNEDIIDEFWSQHVVGWKQQNPSPSYNYGTALDLASNPDRILKKGATLDGVSGISSEDYARSHRSLGTWDDAEVLHTRFAIALFVGGFMIPILLSLLRFVPLPGNLASKARAIFIYPTVWSHRWSVQIRDVGDISPTRGQAIFIIYMLLLNTVAASVGHFGEAHLFWSSDGRQGRFLTCLANRLGALALANIPLLFLYAGRNNLLLKITNWSHTTFIMIHRWLGYFVVIETLLHSVLYLHVALQQHQHEAWSRQRAWYSGCIATIAACLMLPLSIVHLRRRVYEIFLACHITFSVLVLVGTYYHIRYLFGSRISGWIIYLWFSIIFWSCDRVTRIARLTFGGVNRAIVTVIDEEYVRVDIPAARGNGHAYLYFPTLTWRFWENHPFSIASSPAQSSNGSYFKSWKRDSTRIRVGLDTRTWPVAINDVSSPLSDRKSFSSLRDDAKSPLSPLSPMTPLSPWSPAFTSSSGKSLLGPSSTSNLIPPLPDLTSRHIRGRSKGLTFYMRTQTGITALLRKRTTLPVLVEASYNPMKDLSSYPLLICVAGGVGITAILPYLHAHRSGTTRLYWGSRSQGLVDALRDEIRGYNGEVLVGRRLFVKLALQREFARVDGGTPVAVVVSGPRAMGEDVREYCCEVALKRRGEVRFLDENFSW